MPAGRGSRWVRCQLQANIARQHATAQLNSPWWFERMMGMMRMSPLLSESPFSPNTTNPTPPQTTVNTPQRTHPGGLTG